MIKVEFRKHLLKFTNLEWANLKSRFDPENAVLTGHIFRIRIRCKLCTRYKKLRKNVLSCDLCPFAAFAPTVGSKQNGCMFLIETMFPALAFTVHQRFIYWDLSYNYKACRQLKAVQRLMKKTEEAQ